MAKTEVQEILDNFDFYNDDPTNAFKSLRKLYDLDLWFNKSTEKWVITFYTDDGYSKQFTHVNLAQVVQDILEFLVSSNEPATENKTVAKIIMWKDTKEVFTALFGIEPMVNEYEDDIFFWVKNEAEFDLMRQPDNDNYDFVLID